MRTQRQIYPIRLGHQAAAPPEGELRRAGGLLYFDLGEGKDYLYHGQNRFVGVHCHDELCVIDEHTTAPGLREVRKKAAGIPAATIATITGLTAEEIEAITRGATPPFGVMCV